MNRKSSVSMGPGAASLILIFVLLSISVLGMLSLLNSRNDKGLSVRSVEVTEAAAKLNAEAEEIRARLCEELLGTDIKNAVPGVPETVMTGDRISWTVEDDSRTLYCEVRLSCDQNDMIRNLEWVRHTMVPDIGEAGEEWD